MLVGRSLCGLCPPYRELEENPRSWHWSRQLALWQSAQGQNLICLKYLRDYPHSLLMLYLPIALLCFKTISKTFAGGVVQIWRRGWHPACWWEVSTRLGGEILISRFLLKFSHSSVGVSRHSVLLQDLLLGRITGVRHQQSGLARRQASNFGWGHCQQVIKINNVLNSFVKPAPI